MREIGLECMLTLFMASFYKVFYNFFLKVFELNFLGQIVQVIDYISPARYKAVPITKNNPLKDLTVIENPSVVKASPLGWHRSKQNFTNSQGNNAKVYSNVRPGNKRYFVNGGDMLEFLSLPDLKKSPTEKANLEAAIINLFYVINMMHDLTFLYGFTPEAGNFQTLNYGQGGKGGDPVIARVQDTSLYNDANFATSPDGQPGEMNMYLFDSTDPKRDGAMENDIVIHEYQHGIR